MRRGFALVFVTTWIMFGGPAAARCGDSAFLSGGLGAGSLGLAGTASLNVVRGQRLYGLRVAAVEEFNIFGPSPSESASDWALLIGMASASRRGLRFAAAGLGLVRSVRRGRQIHPGGWFLVGPQHERLERLTLGIPFDLHGILHLRGCGLGLSLFGNVNAANTFAGVALTVHLGKIG